eukprot:165004-Pelagomonas_calceolata.AAC.3
MTLGKYFFSWQNMGEHMNSGYILDDDDQGTPSTPDGPKRRSTAHRMTGSESLVMQWPRSNQQETAEMENSISILSATKLCLQRAHATTARELHEHMRS